jgi:DNA-binding IclR family transcriptional regulator
VAVLELLAGSPDERFTLSEVARRCDLNKATAHALLSALSARGVLLRHPDEKRYSLGPRLVAIGDAARRGYRAVDFVPAALTRLGAATGHWARAWQVVGDDVVCVGQVGAPGVAASSVRLPLVPPVGTVFMAWTDAPTVEAWLARAAAVEAVRPALDALPAVARQGFAVMLASPEWRALSTPPMNGADRGAGTDRSARRALLLAVARQPLLLTDLDDQRTYRPADVSAPVFGAGGQVELALSVTLPDGTELGGPALRALGEQVVAAADELTADVRGRRPRRR